MKTLSRLETQFVTGGNGECDISETTDLITMHCIYESDYDDNAYQADVQRAKDLRLLSNKAVHVIWQSSMVNANNITSITRNLRFKKPDSIIN